MAYVSEGGYNRIKTLAKAAGCSVKDLLVLAPQNDPFYAGGPASQEAAEWLAAQWRLFGYGTGVHIRRIHYQIASQGILKPDGTVYENTLREWQWLCGAAKYARELGLVDPLAFVDRRNPDPHIFTQAPTAGDVGTGVGEATWQLPELPTSWEIDWHMPGAFAYGYGYSAGDQPYHLEVWAEKSTVDDVLLPLGRELGLNVVTSLGFQSITSVIAMLQRIQKGGRPARVLYVSDFDMGGDGMPVAVARQAEYWLETYAPGADVALTPLVLTREQVERYELPRVPVSAEKKDRRKAHFEARYGEGVVELDALEALHPGELARIIREAVAPYRDESLQRALADAEQEAQEGVEAAWHEATRPYAGELEAIQIEAQGIIERHKPALEAMAADLTPLRDRLETLRHAVTNVADGLEVGIPERPEADLAPVDESAWLFKSSRDYGAQLAAYKARTQNGI